MKSRSTIARIVRSLFVLAVCGLTASDRPNASAQESEAHPLPFQSTCESTLFAMTDPCESCLEGMESWLDGQDCSLRSGLHDNGVTLTNNLTNFYVGNTLGGNSQQFNFAGHGDYLANFNIHKMGGPQGQFLQIRAEHRYGQSITPASGALLPPILATDIPVRDSEQLYLTNFLFTQAFSESFAVYAGKLDTLGGMNDSLTSGRGIDQFSNLSLINNPLGVKSVAYLPWEPGLLF